MSNSLAPFTHAWRNLWEIPRHVVEGDLFRLLSLFSLQLYRRGENNWSSAKNGASDLWEGVSRFLLLQTIKMIRRGRKIAARRLKDVQDGRNQNLRELEGSDGSSRECLGVVSGRSGRSFYIRAHIKRLVNRRQQSRGSGTLASRRVLVVVVRRKAIVGWLWPRRRIV